MCGIFGAFGDYSPKLVRGLALRNERRGRDSYGFYTGKGVMKAPCSIRYALKESLLNQKHRFILGHTRQATRGTISYRNAHPFRYGDIIGMHNGIVNNFDELKAKYGQDQMEVDSEIIFWGLAKKGWTFLKELRAYWGLAWQDLRVPHFVWLSRNSGMLSYAKSENGKALYYSSDKDDLKDLGFPTTIDVADGHVLRIHTGTLVLREIKVHTHPPYTRDAVTRVRDFDNEEWMDFYGGHYGGHFSDHDTPTQSSLLRPTTALGPCLITQPKTVAEIVTIKKKDPVQVGAPLNEEESKRFDVLKHKVIRMGDEAREYLNLLCRHMDYGSVSVADATSNDTSGPDDPIMGEGKMVL